MEGLTAWLAPPDSFPDCKERGCGYPALEDSDFCSNHQG